MHGVKEFSESCLVKSLLDLLREEDSDKFKFTVVYRA
jgi:hypothetical protein